MHLPYSDQFELRSADIKYQGSITGTRAAILNALLFLYIISVLTVATLPLYNLISMSIGILLCFTSLLILISSKGATWKIPREIRMLLMWLVLGIMSSVAAVDFNASLSKLVTIVQIIIMSLTLLNIIIWTNSIKSVLWAMVFGSLLNMGFAAMFPSHDPARRWCGFLFNSNAFGFLMIIGAFSAIVLFLMTTKIEDKSKFLSLILILLPLIFAYGAFSSGSKMALVGELVTVITAFYAIRKTFHNRIIAYTVLALIAPLTIMLLLNILSDSLVVTRLEQSVNFYEHKAYESRTVSGSTGLRYAYILSGIRMFQENPLLGVGLNNFIPNVKAFSLKSGVHVTYSHNNYIEILATTGLLGFMTFFSIYISIFARLIKRLPAMPREVYLIRHVLLVSFFVLAMIDVSYVSYYDKVFWIWISLLIASCLLWENNMIVKDA